MTTDDLTTDEPKGDDVSTTTTTTERTRTTGEESRRGDPADGRHEPAVAPGPRRGGRAGTGDDHDAPGRPGWVPVAVAACAVALLGITAWSLLRADDLASQQDDRRAAASVAGRFASATMSYDHRDLEGSLAAVTDLATRDYAETYQNAFFEELQPVVDELRARGRVHVRDVYVSEVGDDTATAVVSFDAVIRSTIGTRRLTGSYVRVDLQKEGGAWRADDLTFLATTQEGLDAPDGSGAAGAAGTSPTTAPTSAGD